MDGKYFATNMDPLKSNGIGPVLEKLNRFLEEKNSHRIDEKNASLVAYQIRGSEYRVISVYFLIESGNGLSNALRSDKMQDGLILMYVKDGVIYPVALTEEEYATLQVFGQMFNPVTIINDKPQGQAINLIKGKK